MNEPGTATSGNLMDNEHVRELLGILKDNNKDASGLTALIGHVSDMEDFVKKAEAKISDMKSQLDAMKEIQNHPIKNALQNTIKALETKVAEIKVQIAELKGNIIDGCKNAVAAFKEKGAAVLDKLASFFHIRVGLQSMSKNIDANIRQDDKALVKIEAYSLQYHTAGRALKNMGRLMIGKEPIDAVKESGKLAKVIGAPYKADRAILLGMKKTITKMIASLERLEQKTGARREERAAAGTADKKPTLSEKIKTNKELIKRKELERPAPERVRAPGLEV